MIFEHLYKEYKNVVVTLKKDYKGRVIVGNKPKRKYVRRVMTRGDHKLLTNFVMKTVILIIMVGLAWSSVQASNNYTIVVDRQVVEKERIIFIEVDNGIIDKICKEVGLKNTCENDLRAMRMVESSDGKRMIGDGGISIGWYMIQTKLHNVTEECAMNFECSSRWTAKNLLRNGYNTNRKYAILAHNGVVKGSNYPQRVIDLSNSY